MNLFIRLISTAILLFLLSSCHVGRFFYYNFADVNDYQKFPAQKIGRDSTASQTSFVKAPEVLFVQQSFDGYAVAASLHDYLENHKTLAFLFIRNDTIRHEYYFDDYDSMAVIPVFSVAKSYISALTGIAIDKGFFNNINDSITLYIPELRGKGLEQISIKNLLEMRSGLDYQEKYNSPFADMAKYYYGKNLDNYVSKLKLAAEPGLRYNYQSVNTLLLGIALENATQKSPARLLEEWIWQKTDMEFDASWSVDSKKNNRIKAFCCINLRARDLAKFGKLYLNNGKWKDEQIIPKAWIAESLQIQNDSRDSGGFPYTYHWRTLEDGSFFAKGILGQYLYVNPEKQVIIVRLGKSNDNINWPEQFQNMLRDM
jgi:CubicO group peptidase (beta-lactamase class C family)